MGKQLSYGQSIKTLIKLQVGLSPYSPLKAEMVASLAAL